MNNFYRYSQYRYNNKIPQPPMAPPPPTLPPNLHQPKPCSTNCMQHKSILPKKKKKFDFKCLKKDTCTSLNDVENFLCDFSTFLKYIKLFNLLKK